MVPPASWKGEQAPAGAACTLDQSQRIQVGTAPRDPETPQLVSYSSFSREYL